MPCYDPPPPYEKEQKASAEQAVRLLCESIQSHLQGDPIDLKKEGLQWFIEHRQIDIKMQRDFLFMVSEPFREQLRLEIETAEKQIKKARLALQALQGGG